MLAQARQGEICPKWGRLQPLFQLSWAGSVPQSCFLWPFLAAQAGWVERDFLEPVWIL